LSILILFSGIQKFVKQKEYQEQSEDQDEQAGNQSASGFRRIGFLGILRTRGTESRHIYFV
jgi:hypothetical protein